MELEYTELTAKDFLREHPGLTLEDLIPKCKGCDWCIFEKILLPEQMKIKNIDNEIPYMHVNREIIEQVCAKKHDLRCYMKYIAMRVESNQDKFVQAKAREIYSWDLGVDWEVADKLWTKSQVIDGEEVNPAKRFREVYTLATRKTKNFNPDLTLTIKGLYEHIRLDPQTYRTAIQVMEKLLQEHLERARRK